MASSTQNVVRYSALLFGISYGLLHQSTLQVKYDVTKAKHQADHRTALIAQAKEAYAKKLVEEKAGVKKNALITDPEDPKFDLEKLVNSWAESS